MRPFPPEILFWLTVVMWSSAAFDASDGDWLTALAMLVNGAVNFISYLSFQ